MAFDEELAARIRKLVGKRRGLAEKKMFGGIAFLLNGNMCCGVHREEMIVRIDPEGTGAALKRPHVRIFDISGRPMKGWILVGAGGVAGESALSKWVEAGVAYASSLPPKAE